MILFDSWEDIGRIIVVGVLAYLGLIAFLRISGKRTLSKLNVFDLVVTVALGSTLATILLSRDISLAEGLVAFAVLIGLQYIIAWSSVRSKIISKIVKAEPALVLYRGRLLHTAIGKERVTGSEMLEVLRNSGVTSIDKVDSVVLETDGSFSILKKAPGGEGATTSDVDKRNISENGAGSETG